jgi:WD40 repeat protein
MEEANEQRNAAVREKLVSSIELIGLSGHPNRRSHGLGQIQEVVALDPDSGLRRKLRDEAVKFLALREVESHRPELPTGRAHGLAFGPNGHRLAVLSEDDDELAFWDVASRQRYSTVPLRVGLSTTPGSSELGAGEVTGAELAQGAAPSAVTSGPGRSMSGPPRGAPGSGARGDWNWSLRQRVAQTGSWMAVVLPDEKGLGLIDLTSGAPPRIVPGHVVSVIGDPGGRRFVTIEQSPGEARSGSREGRPGTDDSWFRPEYQVNLWDPEHLERPLATLPWRSDPIPRSAFPLVAISPEGKTVAVAPSPSFGLSRDTKIKLFSALDGKQFERDDIHAPSSVTALALGPNDLLAAAGGTATGPAIHFWDLETNTYFTSLTPATQNFPRLMRFSPQGTLLAITGIGPGVGGIELWDPVAHSLVAMLGMSDQVTDLAFAPDGRTLAAAGRSSVTSVWTVQDPAVRTQLSGLDSWPSSLAFSQDGTLAGGGWNGDVWLWRPGRCPELCVPFPQVSSSSTSAQRSGVSSETRRSDSTGPDVGRRRAYEATSLAYDVQGRLIALDGRLIAHEMRGLRIWPAGASSSQAPAIVRNPNPPPRSSGRGMGMPLLAKTSDGAIMVLVRSSAVSVWRADAPKEIVPVVPPPKERGEHNTGPSTGARRGPVAGVDASVPRFRAVAIAPLGDRIYLLDQPPNGLGKLHVWAIEPVTDESVIRARELNWPISTAQIGFNNIALRGDGAVLALGDRTGSVTLIDTVRRTVLGRMRPSQPSEGMSLAMAFAPDGRVLAVGSQEGTISIWSVAKPARPELRLHLPGHRGPVTNLAFDSQGLRLASTAGFDPLVEVWDLDVIKRDLDQLDLAN